MDHHHFKSGDEPQGGIQGGAGLGQGESQLRHQQGDHHIHHHDHCDNDLQP